MLESRFGMELEFTGLTRHMAAKTIAKVLRGEATYVGGCYDAYEVKAEDGKVWKVMSDASIYCQKKNKTTGLVENLGTRTTYACEMVTPVLTYKEDIDKLQECVRALRKAGAISNSSCGIHIHLDGSKHTVKTVKNFINLVYSREDLIFNAIKVEESRADRWCKKIDNRFYNMVKTQNPQTMEALEDLWYEGNNADWGRNHHYNESRYHFLNLHSFFNGHHTIELRGFNSTLHAGEIRAYVVFALALNDMALNQKSVSSKKPQTDNEKFAMRTWLNRLGLIGEEFKACREHLTKNLNGSSAWRNGRVA